MGDHQFDNLPEPIRWLTTNINPRTYDPSGMGVGTDCGAEDGDEFELEECSREGIGKTFFADEV